jgi:hypothetical protein
MVPGGRKGWGASRAATGEHTLLLLLLEGVACWVSNVVDVWELLRGWDEAFEHAGQWIKSAAGVLCSLIVCATQ